MLDIKYLSKYTSLKHLDIKNLIKYRLKLKKLYTVKALVIDSFFNEKTILDILNDL